MNESKKKFLYLNMVEDKKYTEITQILGVDRATLTTWYEELYNERTIIVAIKNLWRRKHFEIDFSIFYDWYLKQDRKCFYCGISEEEIKQLLEKGLLKTKRIVTRGKKLELDRQNPDLDYSEIENLVLSCYWCNNAKTDTFTSEEFSEVGKAFKEIWNKRLLEL